MLKNKQLLFSIPLMLIGFSMIILGFGWLISSEPWMLDQLANEERLNMSFYKLFEAEINSNLPGYLKQIYRFFGFWVMIIGLFICMFSRLKIIKQGNIRFSLIFCIGIMVYIGLMLGYWLIPSSPFIYFGYILIALHSISLFNYFRLK